MDVVAKAKDFETSSRRNICFLVDFDDNCGELSGIALFGLGDSIGYFYHPTFRYLYYKPSPQIGSSDLEESSPI